MKIAVLGKGMVGKSSLTYKYINYNTPKDHDPTIEDKYSTVATVNGINCEVEILDTAGQDDYQSLINYWISFGEAFVLVYAINDRESFNGLEEKRDRILRMKKDEVCSIVLVGNKSDLENQRTVQLDEGAALAKKWGCAFFETSVFVSF
jgi:small GTP-binding protein